METEINFFSEDRVYDTVSGHQQSGAYFSFFNEASPNGDDEDEEDKDDEEGDDASDDDENPPLDSDVKHSPVTTMPGGKPK